MSDAEPFESNGGPPLNDEDRLRRARRATEILNDEITQKALLTYRSTIWNAWVKSPKADVEGREQLWNLALACRIFEKSLRNVMDTGKLLLAEEQAAAQGQDQEDEDGAASRFT